MRVTAHKNNAKNNAKKGLSRHESNSPHCWMAYAAYFFGLAIDSLIEVSAITFFIL